MQESERLKILKKFGADDYQAGELLRYNQTFSRISSDASDEPFIHMWEEYSAEADRAGVFDTLKKYLVQISFPICEGISGTKAYKNATLRGIIPPERGDGVVLAHKEALSLYMHKTAAGRIPVLFTEYREDFVTLVRALSRRNEPCEIPDSMGACMVSGYNNWDRIKRYRRTWEDERQTGIWDEEFTRMKLRKELYQDCFIILSNNGYSGIPAYRLGLSENEWKRMSVVIRLEHECAHYITKRFFGSARNNAFDELIADYAGITAALGSFNADWFLLFMGLERYPEYRQGARLENYRGSLSDGAFKVLQNLVYHSALNLKTKPPAGQIAEAVIALYVLSLEELADMKDSLGVTK